MDCYKFCMFKDDRGGLVAWENNKNIPFEIKRVFCIYGEEGKKRGLHAHKTEEEVMVCLKGSCTVVLHDGDKESTHLLDDPCDGLYIGKLTWLEMRDFSKDTILLVLSNSVYNEDDYIWEFDHFMKEQQSE